MGVLLGILAVLSLGCVLLGALGDAIDRHERTRPAPMARFGPGTRLVRR